MTRTTFLGFALIILLGFGAAYIHKANIENETSIARHHFKASQSKIADAEARKVETAFKTIYQNIRTISFLPAVINIDRHAKNLTDDGRKTIQQIYNNLASSVAISEVYVLPVGFNPEKQDLVTGKPEEPIIMFDQLIINAGKYAKDENPFAEKNEPTSNTPAYEEVEIHEYRQLKKQLAWLKLNYPTSKQANGLKIPMISGSEVITCDNTHFVATLNDADRKGMMFSVPFYGQDGKLKGMVTAIILSNAVADLLPGKNFALLNGVYGFQSKSHPDGQETKSKKWVAQIKPDPSLIFSKTINLSVPDPRSDWRLWAGQPNSAFTNSNDFIRIQFLSLVGYLAITVLTLALLACWWLYMRNICQARTKAETARKTADEIRKAHEQAVESEAEAREMANQLQVVNEDVIKLNRDLEVNFKKLTEAQNEIVRKGKLAQLGELTATVAHEIRNPLGAVRTSAFLVRRKFASSNPDMERPLSRIESGIQRCDNIISELLDFTRKNNLNVKEGNLDDWLLNLVREQADSLPKQVNLECHLGLGETLVEFDPDRLSRAVINFLTNASEAMVGKGKEIPDNPTENPKITIQTKLTERGVEILATDNGPGISKENLEKIFTPLFTTKGFGVGLGLPAVEQIFTQHGGGLEVSSTLNQGATFTGWFPTRHEELQVSNG